jgi:hypothetical protein
MSNSQDSNADTHPNAGRDSGYVAPVGEDLVNVLTVLIAKLETKLLQSNMALKSEIGNQGDIRREQIRELTNLVDRRHDGLAGELDKLIAATEVTARGLGKSQSDIEELLAVQALHAERLDVLANIEEWRTGVDSRLLAIEEADRADIHAEIKDIKAALIRYEEKHQELIRRLEARAADPPAGGS